MATSDFHPAELSIERLADQCRLQPTKGSGPGGQRRNKVATGVRLTHEPTGTTVEAMESRSAEENRRVALSRLRWKLARELRGSRSRRDRSELSPSELWQSRCQGGRIAVNFSHEDAPALVAEALDVFVAVEADYSAASEILNCSTTQLRKFLGRDADVRTVVDDLRSEAGLPRLKPG